MMMTYVVHEERKIEMCSCVKVWYKIHRKYRFLLPIRQILEYFSSEGDLG